MKRSTTHIHRGHILRDAVDATRLNKDAVATKAGYTRSSYYKHIQDPDLPYHILTAYGKAIRHDFTELLPEMPKYVIEEPQAGYERELTIDDALKQIDYWRGKYIDLLEQFNRLVLQMRGK